MYYPIQVPYLLDKNFQENVEYTETIIPGMEKFVVCFWEMTSHNDRFTPVSNVIVSDACIDLVVDFNEKIIGYGGMSQTDFQYRLSLPCTAFGLRLMPGAFHQLTGLEACCAMDGFISLGTLDSSFDTLSFFQLDPPQAKQYLLHYFKALISDQVPNAYTLLFSQIFKETPLNTTDLQKRFKMNPRQCQRHFMKHFGLTPKRVLTIIRFHQCVQSFINNTTTNYPLNYYDQSHLIKDFKMHIGITPQTFVKRYRNDAFLQYTLPPME